MKRLLALVIWGAAVGCSSPSHHELPVPPPWRAHPTPTARNSLRSQPSPQTPASLSFSTPTPQNFPSFTPTPTIPHEDAPARPAGQPTPTRSASWTVLPDEDAPPLPTGQPYQDNAVTWAQNDKPGGRQGPAIPTSISEVDDRRAQKISSLAWKGALPTDLESVDRYALAAPPEAEKTTAALASYLAGAGQDGIHKLRAIYTWEAHRIAYDLKVMDGSPASTSQAPDDVLRNKLATCDGFARLYVVLAQGMGLEAETVLGYGKGPLMFIRDTARPNHRWVRARVTKGETGCWSLIDPTWGRAYSADKSWRFEGRYFLTDPSQFIEGHWPCDSRWQLLSPPLSQKGWGFWLSGRHHGRR